MKYRETHPRKVRGDSIHQTFSEKIEGLAKREHSAPAEFLKQGELEEALFSQYDGIKKELADESERTSVEGTYLVPEIDHFVDTPDVKRIRERIKLWINIGYPVHLIGPTGCGKTSLAMHTARELGRPTVWINGDESITTSDLVGGYSQVEQVSLRDKYIHNVFKSTDIMRAEWIDNPLAIACKYGYTLIYNEFSRTKPAANNVLLSVFEEGILELPTKFGEDRYIKVHPDFNAILTSNSIEYAGVHRPQDALLDRMVSIYMEYYSFDTEVEIVSAHTGLPESDARKIVSVVRLLRENLPDAQKPGTRACIMIGKGMKAQKSDVNFEQICVDVLATKTSSPMDMLEKQHLIKDVLVELT